MIQKLIGILILIAVLYGSGFASGYLYAKRAYDKGVIKQQKTDAKEVAKHEEKQRVVVKRVERIKRVLVTIPDSSGCLDTDSPADYIERLQRADSKQEP